MWRGEPFLELESELAHAGRVRLDEPSPAGDRGTDRDPTQPRCGCGSDRRPRSTSARQPHPRAGPCPAGEGAHRHRSGGRCHAGVRQVSSNTGRRARHRAVSAVPGLERRDHHRDAAARTCRARDDPLARCALDATPLVGGQAVLDDVVRLAASERLVTLLGTGGAGQDAARCRGGSASRRRVRRPRRLVRPGVELDHRRARGRRRRARCRSPRR